jgi:uncharacterized phage protein (TIGR01671 family)
MRTIKFRVWSIESKSFLDSDDIAIRNNGLILTYDWHHDYGKSWGSSFENHIVQQYTGLLDKNGKEIYEGDILKLTFSEESLKKLYKGELYKIITKNSKTEFIGEVTSDYSHGILSHFSYHVGGIMPFWYFKQLTSRNGIEVIGNIFENPELIKN